MKKLFALLAAAVMTLTASAQNVEMKQFDCKLFSCLYPATMEAQEQWVDECFNAESGEALKFSITLNEQAMSAPDMKEWGDGMKMMIERSFGEPTGWKASAPVIKGQTLTIRAEKEIEVYEETSGEDKKVNVVKITYLTNTSDNKSFSGELIFPQKEEAQYTAALTKIFNSAKVK